MSVKRTLRMASGCESRPMMMVAGLAEGLTIRAVLYSRTAPSLSRIRPRTVRAPAVCGVQLTVDVGLKGAKPALQSKA